MSRSDGVAFGRSKAPLYRSIQADIQRRILSGELERGSWLESESRMREHYSASQTSVRRALLELERLGLIERFQGRGSVIAANEIRAISPMLGMGEELRQRGFDVTSVLLANAVVPAPAPVAEHLGLEPGTDVRHIERVYATGDDPLVVLDYHFRSDLVSDFDDFEGGSLYAYLLVRNALPAYANEKVFAINTSDREAELLKVPAGTAALGRERVSFDAAGRPVEHTRYLLRADRYHLQMYLQSSI